MKLCKKKLSTTVNCDVLRLVSITFSKMLFLFIIGSLFLPHLYFQLPTFHSDVATVQNCFHSFGFDPSMRWWSRVGLTFWPNSPLNHSSSETDLRFRSLKLPLYNRHSLGAVSTDDVNRRQGVPTSSATNREADKTVPRPPPFNDTTRKLRVQTENWSTS